MNILLKIKPHIYFWISALYILTLGYISYLKTKNSVLDINIHDTYFVVAKFHISIALFGFYSVLGVIYFSYFKLNIPLLKWCTILHTAITIGVILIYEIFSNFVFNSQNEFPIVDNNSNLQRLLVILVFVVAPIQILAIFNFLFSSILHFKKTK